MTIQDILSDIHALEEDLLHFERNMASVLKPSTLHTLAAKNPKTIVGCWTLGNGPASTGHGWLVRQSTATLFNKCNTILTRLPDLYELRYERSSPDA